MGWVDAGVAVSGQAGDTLRDAGGIEGVLANPKNAAAWGLYNLTGIDHNGELHKDELLQSVRQTVLRSLAWGIGKRIGMVLPGVKDVLREGANVKIAGRPLWRLRK
jgi:hypothetical protein